MGADSNEIDEIKMSTLCEEDEKEKRRKALKEKEEEFRDQNSMIEDLKREKEELNGNLIGYVKIQTARMEAERLLYRDEIEGLKKSISKIDRETHESMARYRSASSLLETEYGRQSPLELVVRKSESFVELRTALDHRIRNGSNENSRRPNMYRSFTRERIRRGNTFLRVEEFQRKIPS